MNARQHHLRAWALSALGGAALFAVLFLAIASVPTFIMAMQPGPLEVNWWWAILPSLAGALGMSYGTMAFCRRF